MKKTEQLSLPKRVFMIAMGALLAFVAYDAGFKGLVTGEVFQLHRFGPDIPVTNENLKGLIAWSQLLFLGWGAFICFFVGLFPSNTKVRFKYSKFVFMLIGIFSVAVLIIFFVTRMIRV